MKNLNRTDSLKTAQEIPNSGGKALVYADTPGGVRKLRCPKCGGVAVESIGNGGKRSATCGTCGTAFTSTAL